MVAFVASLLVTVVLTGAVVAYAGRRPVDTPLSWGEAMGAAFFVFFLAFWVYGVVPHQWLTWADNELGWRSDKFLAGPAGLLEKLPLTLTYLVLRDLIVVTLYAVFLGAHIMLWSMWQKRGQAKPVEIEASSYGRPLVRRS
ncbi:hypothetical protein BH20ACT2_BH20ACT2_09110 [soil metagenome]